MGDTNPESELCRGAEEEADDGCSCAAASYISSCALASSAPRGRSALKTKAK